LQNLLILLTYRPEFDPPWPHRANLTVIQLARLDHDDAHEVIGRVVGGRPIPREVAEQIVSRTDGVPLFVEELTKMVLESGLLREDGDQLVLDGPLPAVAIPETLHDSLMARLDRLGMAKETAQLGATLGREFTQELISAVSPVSPDALQSSLDRLVHSGLAYRRGVGSTTRYVFKHALVQDAAYNSLLKSTRARYHRRAADVLAARFPSVTQGQPEIVARHYTEAGATEEAVQYWHLAGVRARERSADREAIAHLDRGLELIEHIPQTDGRDRAELNLQIALGPALRATRGYTGAGVEAAFDRARVLCEKLEDRTHLLPALWGLWSFHMVQAHHDTSYQLAERCLELAEERGDLGHIAQAHRAYATAKFWIGDFAGAKHHADYGASLYDRGSHAPYTLAYGIDVGVGCLAWSSWPTWYLGLPDEALSKAQAALVLAKDLSHPFSIGLAHCWLASVYLLRRECDQSLRHAENALGIAEEHGIAQWRWYGSVLAGRASAAGGHVLHGLALMRTGIQGWLAMGAHTEMPHFSGLLAEVHLLAGQHEEAAAVLTEGFGYIDETGECYFEPELYRLRGELLAASDVESAERNFRRALEISNERSARSLALRASMSLGRLLQSRGRTGEAFELLSPVLGAFTEGSESRDLVDARELLDRLQR
jgi:predicted ATPase